MGQLSFFDLNGRLEQISKIGDPLEVLNGIVDWSRFDAILLKAKVGVCKDELIYWVLTSEELENTDKFGFQHRNENTGVEGIDVFEGQVFMTEDELAPFCVEESKLVSIIRSKCKKV